MKLTHDMIERNQALLIVLVILVVAVGGLVEIVPLSFMKSVTEPVAGLKPYAPLQLTGRDIYIREGCYNCHSQMVRPLRFETERYGEYSKPGESVYDHPFLFGSRRLGPDLAREGGLKSNLWHLRHFENPREINARSIMPAYPHLSTADLDYAQIQKRVDVMTMLGVPYGDAVAAAPELARAQARGIAEELAAQGGRSGLENREVVALIAYMQRL